MISYWGAGAGSLTKGQRATWAAVTTALKREAKDKERARIALLSEKDAVLIMGRVIAEAAAKRANVTRLDFRQAGIPEDRIDPLFDRAMARARRLDPLVDAMGAAA